MKCHLKVINFTAKNLFFTTSLTMENKFIHICQYQREPKSLVCSHLIFQENGTKNTPITNCINTINILKALII